MKNYPSMTVYSASAGSGKTFTLAVRYIELLIKDPSAYQKTLAVTFTNKATEEMKMRILSQLYGLWQGLDDSADYMERITGDLGVSEALVRNNAKEALELMLHDYSRFCVETIDAFFQRVLRNMARELELNANLRVELNDYDIENIAVDNLMSKLTDKHKVMRWVMDYISQNMDEEKGWNVIDSIKKFGKRIFTDDYKKHSAELEKVLEDDNVFNSFKEALRNMVKDADEKMTGYAATFYKILADNNLSVEKLSNKEKGAASYFNKLKAKNYLDTKGGPYMGARALAGANGPEGWVGAQCDPSAPLYIIAAEQLVPLICKAEEERQKLIVPVSSAKVILQNLNELRLLHEIEKEVDSINSEENRFLLSSTQHKLHELMGDSDAPFVFEKIGSHLRNIMIDEFQDTSTIQWENFKKLLCNIIAEGGSQNLIVGDVKQSIYRWRNGDWSLLHNIQHDKSITQFGFDKLPLSDNWRSEERIINFNNSFFDNLADKAKELLEADDNRDADVIRQMYQYELLKQNVPEEKRKKTDYSTNGSVEIKLIDCANNEEYDQEALSLTREYITRLIEAGAREESIAILIRSNSYIRMFAREMQKLMPEHKFISDEAFMLEASQAVNILIAAMRCLNHPNDILTRASLAQLYQQHVLNNNTNAFEINGIDNINRLLPRDFITDRTQLLSMPLIDMAERLFQIFGLEAISGEAAYIYGFYDQLNTFSQNNVPDLEMFLKQWDEILHLKSVQVGNVNGIRLVTVHKSKGLEFDHVIIPNCSWSLEGKEGNCLWCTTDEKPFSTMPVLPVNSRNIKNTIYDEQYHREHLENIIDNINMLYVAFTRAKKNLFIIGKNACSEKSGMSFANVSGLLQVTLPELVKNESDDHHFTDGATLSGDCSKKEEITYLYGELFVPQKKSEGKASENVFMQKADDVLVGMKTENHRLDFRQSNESRNFVETDTDDKLQQLHYIHQGTILHAIMSRIENISQLDEVLEDYLGQGVIDDNNPEISRETIARIIRQRIEENPRPEIQQWFSPDVQVMNEQSIVFMNEGIVCQRRPDRVIFHNDEVTVIDFKFGQQKESYKNQVAFYMRLLTEMGYKNVHGYLWYVYSNEVVPC